MQSSSPLRLKVICAVEMQSWCLSGVSDVLQCLADSAEGGLLHVNTAVAIPHVQYFIGWDFIKKTLVALEMPCPLKCYPDSILHTHIWNVCVLY